MNNRDPELQTVLLQSTPRPQGDANWQDVLQRAQRGRLPRWVATRLAPSLAVAVACGLLAVLFVRVGDETPTRPANSPPVELLDRPQVPDDAHGILGGPLPNGVIASSLRIVVRLDAPTRSYYAGRNPRGDVCLLSVIGTPTGTSCTSAEVFSTNRVTKISSVLGSRVETVGLVADGITRARLVGGEEVDVHANAFVLRGDETNGVEVFAPTTGWRAIDDSQRVRFDALNRPATPDDRAAQSFSFVEASGMAQDTIRIVGSFDDTTFYGGYRDDGSVCVVSYMPRFFSTPICSPLTRIRLDGGLPIQMERSASQGAVAVLVPDFVSRARIKDRDIAIANNLVVTRTPSPDALEVLTPTGWHRLGRPAVAAQITTVPSKPAPLSAPRSAYTVLIRNGSTHAGVASALVPAVRALGWTVRPPDNDGLQAQTVVAYLPGREVVADNLAQDLAISRKRPISAMLQVGRVEEFDVVVILGEDLGFRTPNGSAAATTPVPDPGVSPRGRSGPGGPVGALP